MRTLHVFNPSHDEALAANSAYYTPSKIAQRLRCEWAFLPSLWARAGDAVWVDEASDGVCPWRSEVACVKSKQMNAAFWQGIDRIEPWGWDALICEQLRKAGAPLHLLPNKEEIQTIRQLSSRHTTTLLLPRLREELAVRGIATTGLSTITTSEEEVNQLVNQHQRVMAKALWSCSGRGVFPLSAHPTESERGRVRKLLHEQGGIELEPLYEGEMNFALEFDIDTKSGAKYAGLSLFRTSPSGNYLGNRIAPPSLLEESLTEQGVELQPLAAVCTEVLNKTIGESYAGPLGIDMMLVKQANKMVLHPCIEVNLRMTMGRVAVHLQQAQVSEIPAPFQSLFCIE